MKLCECGCGQEVKLGNRFIRGHNHKGVSRSQEHCDAISRAKMGVARKPFTPEHKAAMSRVKIGISKPPRTPEACSAMSVARLNSDVAQRLYENMRGGNDICNHHYIYDHSDLSKNTIGMTRSDHTRLHHLLNRLGFKVPHINDNQMEVL